MTVPSLFNMITNIIIHISLKCLGGGGGATQSAR